MDRMRQLVDELNGHGYKYYVLDEPTVSDAEYDKLYDELVRLERESGVVLPDSPTRKIGGEPIKGFVKHTHLSKLYSLDKCNTTAGLIDFDTKIKKLNPDAKYTVEYKLDGLTLCLTYQDGFFKGASTRGNGEVGEDVTAQVLTIKSVPLQIDFKGLIEVQGEGIMRISAFDKYNKTADEPLKNPRNGVAGAIRNLDPAVTARRNLDIIFYNINYIDGLQIKSQSDCIEFLRKNKFKVENPFVSGDINKIADYIDNVDKSKLDFVIDGMVIKLNNFIQRDELGYTDKFPRWAIAYKFEAEETTTRLNDVVWNVGRTGKLTPLAILQPVELCGATIRKATLNNMGDILRKKVRKGATVFLRRSNDVIPEILGVADPEGGEDIIPPDVCPACGSVLKEDGANLFCTNTEGCRPQIIARIEHFASKDCMDIRGISEKTVGQLYDSLGIKSPADLYDIKVEKLLSLEGFKDKKADNFLASVDSSKKVSLDKFLNALSIGNIGKKTARDLAEIYGSVGKLSAATKDELVKIDEVGDIMAEGIVAFFADENNKKLLSRFKEIGIDPTYEKIVTDSPFSGKSIVITGTLNGISRNDAQKLLEKAGAKIASAVSKNTDLLIFGDSAGSKLEKAKKLGVEVMDGDTFLKLI